MTKRKMALKRASSRLELTDELNDCIPAYADTEKGFEALKV